MVTVQADLPYVRPPEWALLERQLIELMNGAVEPLLQRYVRANGEVLWPTTEDFQSIDGLDDAYESFHNWPLFQALGGAPRVGQLAQREFDAITAQFSRYDTGFGHPMVVDEFEQGYDWMHMGEGYTLFYLLSLANPGHQVNAERAARYARLFTGEPNYDADRRLLRCAHLGSMGPAYRNFERYYTRYAYASWKPWPLPFLDLPGISTVEDLRDPANELRMGAAIVERMARGDVAVNLASTSLVTHACLLTGDDGLRRWVFDYVQAWMERAARNGGVVPDNVGPGGRIGECMGGKWYGGYYGWSWPHGWHTLGDAVVSAAQNVALLAGDPTYMDFARAQIDALVAQGQPNGGTINVPHFHNDRGWDGYAPLAARYLAHLWTTTMAADDLERVRRLRDHGSRDHTRVVAHFSKHGGGHEAAWMAWLMGEYPGYPEDILRHTCGQVYQRLAFMQDDRQDPATYGDWYLQVRNPIFVEALVQLTMGAPLFNYNGGLQLARLRHFDGRERRPGLPADTAALVHALTDRSAALDLVNLSPNQPRQVVVQAGTFGEHRFTDVRYGVRQETGEATPFATELEYRARVERETAPRSVTVNDRAFTVALRPATWVRLELGMERFANRPSYDLPWE